MLSASKHLKLGNNNENKGLVAPCSTAVAGFAGISTKQNGSPIPYPLRRMSPKKVREVARTIQGRKAADAVEYLTLVPRKSARLIAKTLRSAIANAENNNNLSTDSLVVKSAIIENGPVLKRFKAGARGTAMPRRKKMSHIRIVLTDGSSNS